MEHHRKNPPPPPPPQKCPRCDSSNTKFCYYNNYSLSQPRYFCKSCRRYWTHGGTLRNVPVGGTCRRKTKRPKPSAAAPPPLPALNPGQAVGSSPTPVGNSFYSGGVFLSTFAGMQSIPPAASLGLLQGMRFPVSNECFQSAPPLTWTQSFFDRGFWSGASAAAGGNQAGPSSDQNNWPENNHGFDHAS